MTFFPDQFPDHRRERIGRFDQVAELERIARDNAVKEAAARAGRIAVGSQGVEGNQQISHESPGFLARITKRSSLNTSYEWIRVRPRTETEVEANDPIVFHDLSEAGYGTEDNELLAWESSGAINVPVNGSAIVELRPTDGGRGFEFTWNGSETLWARLDEYSNVSGNWAWTEMIPLSPGTFEEASPGLSGTNSDNPAYERHGRSGISEGAIVQLIRGACSGYPHVEVTLLQAPEPTIPITLKHQVRIRNSAGGTFTLAVGSAITASLAYDIGLVAFSAAISTLVGSAVNVTGAGTDASPYVIEYLSDGYVPHQLPTPDNTELIGDQEWLFEYSENCVVPIAIRIDGGDETAGYEWTAMRQVEGSPGDWEAIAGWNDTDLGFLAYEANGETVAAGAFIYPGQVDFCRQKAFFFFGNGVGGSRIILEFLEDSPSFGDLYLARITTELVDSFGSVSWTTGATVYAFPINQTLTPTLETLYFAYRTEEEEIVGGLLVYEVDRCCDAEGNQSSSGSVTTCECADLALSTASISGVGDVALTFSGGGWNADFEVTGEDWNISVTCIDHYFGIGQRGVIVGLYRVSDGAGFDSSIKGCDEALSWLAEEFDPPASGLDVSLS